MGERILVEICNRCVAGGFAAGWARSRQPVGVGLKQRLAPNPPQAHPLWGRGLTARASGSSPGRRRFPAESPRQGLG
jgi:hypothetical protein